MKGKIINQLINYLMSWPILSPNRVLRVAVTGAAGQIAYNLLQDICSGSVFVWKLSLIRSFFSDRRSKFLSQNRSFQTIVQIIVQLLLFLKIRVLTNR